jgi:aspartate kinase
MVISRENLHDEPRFRKALESRFGRSARLLDGLAAVSAVGAGINATYAHVRSGSTLLAERGIVPTMVATSSFRITWMLPRDRTSEAVQALHHGFIESAQPLLP